MKNIKEKLSICLLLITTSVSAQFNTDFSYSMTDCDSVTVSFYNLTAPTTNRSWDFGDGSNSIEAQPVHQYDIRLQQYLYKWFSNS